MYKCYLPNSSLLPYLCVGKQSSNGAPSDKNNEVATPANEEKIVYLQVKNAGRIKMERRDKGGNNDRLQWAALTSGAAVRWVGGGIDGATHPSSPAGERRRF